MYLNQLDAALQRQLKPIYLISGDVPLLIQETRDKIRNAAKQKDFQQREILTVEPGFDWQMLRQRLQTRSLFSEKSIIDLRLSKWEDNASKILLEYLAAIAEDLILLISTSKLTGAQQKTKWHKAIAAAGETITIWPVAFYELPRWIQQRFRAANIQADAESIQLLAEWTEGNLLATQQVIEKLPLIYPNQKITVTEMSSVLNDNARFTIFDFSNAALSGNAKRTIRILAHLQFEGIEPTLVLWTLAREIRHLIQLLDQQQHGTSLQQLLQKEWQSRKTLISAALQRHHQQNLLTCLQHASRIDKIIKGMKTGNCWHELESLALSVAGSQND